MGNAGNAYGRADFNADMDDIEVRDQAISIDVAHKRMTGLDSLKATASLEAEKRKAKGRMIATRSRVMDSRASSQCNYPMTHTKGCQCKRLYGSIRQNKNKKPTLTASELSALQVQIAEARVALRKAGLKRDS